MNALPLTCRPISSRPRGRFRFFRWLALALLVAAALAWWAALSLGRILYHEDPIERADAIFVLGGSWLERVAEGGDLYLEGHAPLVVLSRELPDTGEQALRARGIDVPSVTDVHVRALTAMGVPRDAIHVIEPQIATATEAASLAQSRRRTEMAHGDRRHAEAAHRARAPGVHAPPWRSRAFRSSCARHATTRPMWIAGGSDRVSFRFALFEGQKMLAYWVGLAD